MSTGQLVRISHAATGAAHSEIAAVRKVLELQQKENYRLKDHVRMLDGEIDSLKDLCMTKQNEIIACKESIRLRDDKVKELQNCIETNRVDKNGIQLFSEQNNFLVEKVKMEHSKLEDAVREIAKMKDENSHLRETIEIKSDASSAIEARFQADLSEVRTQLINEKDAKKLAHTSLSSSQRKLSELVSFKSLLSIKHGRP